jgi:CrcB protein
MTDVPRPSTTATAGVVAAGGVVGTSLRAGLEQWLGGTTVPWITLAINLAGAFALGLLLEGLARTGEDVGRRRMVRMGLGAGVIGGFTTYSTFVLEAVRLLEQGHAELMVGYLAGSLVLGVGAAWLGLTAADRLTRRSAAPGDDRPEADR